MTVAIHCPDCEPTLSRSGRRIDPQMGLIEDNYHGTGEDVYHCVQCGHVFFVSYKVDNLTRAKDWEDEEEITRLAEEKKERQATSILRALLQGSPEEQEKARQLGQRLICE